VTTTISPVPTEETVPKVRDHKVKRAGSKKLAGYAVLLVFAVIFLSPFLIEIATSFKDDPQAAAHPLSLIPNPFDLAAWKRMFGLTPDTPVPILTWLGNSVLVTVIVTPSRVFLDSLAGYALSRLHFRGRPFLFGAVLAVMSVPGVALLVPKFLIVTYLGMFDTYEAMILPLLVDAAGIFIMKQFFDSVSVEIEEAARIDGAGDFRIFLRIVLPLSRPAIATLAVLSFLANWNDFLWPVYVLLSPEKLTLQPGLSVLQGAYSTHFGIVMAGAVIASIPVLIIFTLAQRQIVDSVARSGLKG